jgi:hypothetical protein
MNAFPSLEPLRREWSFPLYPTLDVENNAWGSTTFEYGEEPVETPLDLVYTVLSEAEMQLLRDHYSNQRQVFSFGLPAAVWAGYFTSESVELFPTDREWFYAAELEEEPIGPGMYDCTVKLISTGPS